MPVRPWPHAQFEYAGVFLLDTEPAEFEDEFIDAEPPSHDDWLPEERGRNARNVVRIALRRIREAADAFTDAGQAMAHAQAQDPLGALSEELGQLLLSPPSAMPEGTTTDTGDQDVEAIKVKAEPGNAEADNTAAVTADNSGTDCEVIAATRRRAVIRLLDGGQLVQGSVGGELHLRFSVDGRIPHGACLRAFPRIVVAGGQTERDIPDGAATARVLGWRDPTGREWPAVDTLGIDPGTDGQWLLRVSVPLDAMVSVTVAIAATKAQAEV
jgi:hypothetical protein